MSFTRIRGGVGFLSGYLGAFNFLLVRRPAPTHGGWSMKPAHSKPAGIRRVLVLVDESNVTSSAKAANRKLAWLKLQEFLVRGRELLETVIYAGLPPAMPEWQAERDKKN